MKVTLQKEMEYKENMEKSHHGLLMEQQDLHIKLVIYITGSLYKYFEFLNP